MKRLLLLFLLLAGCGTRAVAPPPPEMVLVPGGEFLAGTDDQDADEDFRPLHSESVGPFYIDRCEVTNADYQAFNPSHHYPEGADRLPVTHLTREQAQDYLHSLGKRLPTGLEWEKAARGTDGRRYSWGNQWDPSRAHVGGKGELREKVGGDACSLPRLDPVGSFPSGASPYGCLDMIGNAWEWVSDDVRGHQVIRGGAFGYAPRFCRTYVSALEDTGMT